MVAKLFATALLVGSSTARALTSVTDAEGGVPLITFDGAESTTFGWHAENDPVMGGLSHSTFAVENNTGVFDGEVKIVPALSAPGFCFLHTEGVAKFPSATGYSHLELTLRNAGMATDYESFKVSFAANTLNPQFRNFKAGFNVSANASDWTTVAVPFSEFTNKWSPATGEPTVTCAEDPSVCVTEDDLAHIYQFGIWAEGKKGQFHLEVQSIRVFTPQDDTMAHDSLPAKNLDNDWNNTCGAHTQKSLRFNVSVAGAYVQLPFVPPGGLPSDESFADAICCDAFFRPFAEPSGFFAQPDVDLFGKLNTTAETTFYDSVCGEPLFVAPRNRSFAAWQAETEEHGWPSFRDEEVLPGAITVDKASGIVYSKCGTHLGSYLPDAGGDRYCLDLACLSGSPKK